MDNNELKKSEEITNAEVKSISNLVNKVNEFYKSNYALLFFMTATTIFASIQIILYSLNILEVNGWTLEESQDRHHVWSSWILLMSSIVSCYCGFVGGVMLFRGSLSFVYWQNIATILGFLTQALASMWFGAFVSLYFILMNFVRYYVWKNELVEKWNLSPEKVITLGLIVFISILLVLNISAGLWGSKIYSHSDWMKGYNYQFDATAASFNIAASFIMLFKSRWTFVFYAAAKIFSIWNYFDAGLIVPIIQMLLFWIMDATGFIGWTTKAIEPTETAIETDYE